MQNNTWYYSDEYNNTEGYIEFVEEDFSEYLNIINSNSASYKKKINVDNNGTEYSSMIITEDDFRIISSRNDDVILNEIGTVNTDLALSEADSALAYYVLPDE